MKKALLRAFTYAVFCVTAVTANAQSQALSMATGATDGRSTYGTVAKEMTAACNGAVISSTTNGSLQSLQQLLDNKVALAFVQGDVLIWKSQQTDASNIKVLIPLFPEEVHVVARNSELKEGGFMGFGAHKFVVKTVDQLRGRKVGAVGGSAISANVINSTGKYGWQVVEYQTNDAALKALADGDIDGFVAVGGSPLPVVAGLDQRYRLAAFPQAMIDALSKHYTPVKVSYPKMGAGGSVTTIATQAQLVTQNYKGKKKAEELNAFRQCVYDNLDDIRETTGTHAKWRDVPDAAHAVSKWPVFGK